MLSSKPGVSPNNALVQLQAQLQRSLGGLGNDLDLPFRALCLTLAVSTKGLVPIVGRNLVTFPSRVTQYCAVAGSSVVNDTVLPISALRLK
jgi:hypothetical protein